MERYENIEDGFFKISTFKGKLFCKEYRPTKGDSLTNISYNNYGDSRYWWAIAIANDIEDPFEFINNTPKVLYLPHISEMSKL